MEECICSFLVGYKNRLLAGHANRAHAGATFISQLETVKANDLELMLISLSVEQLAPFKDQTGSRSLLPQYIDLDRINHSAPK